MTLRTFLLMLAVGCALVLPLIDFGLIDVDGDPNFPAWVGLSLAFLAASFIPFRYDR